MSVKFTHPDYKKLATKWSRVRDVCAGQDAMQVNALVYIPKLRDQDDKEYAAYVKRANFYNASWRTIEGFLGMLFRKPPVIEVPAAVEPYLEDVSQNGTDFTELLQDITEESLEVWRVGILVDYPPAPKDQTPTKADAEKLGLRPTMQLYPAETIINWKHKQINNKKVLSLVVLTEQKATPKDEFEDSVETVYRVLDLDEAGLYRQRVMRSKDGMADELIEGPIYPLMNNQALTFIPFFCDFCFEEPPLIDLIDLNISHYRVSADYEHGCHFTGLPTPWIAGYQNTKPETPASFYIGSTSAWVFPDANAKCDFLEFKGQGLTSLKENMSDKEARMVILGARMLAPDKAAAETAFTSAIHRAGEQSVLSNVAQGVSAMVKDALLLFIEWATGEKPNEKDVKCDLNRDFMPVGMDAPTLMAWIALCQSGHLSDESLHDLLVRSDLTDNSFEDEQTKIDAQGPKLTLPAPGLPGGGPAPAPAVKKPTAPANA